MATDITDRLVTKDGRLRETRYTLTTPTEVWEENERLRAQGPFKGGMLEALRLFRLWWETYEKQNPNPIYNREFARWIHGRFECLQEATGRDLAEATYIENERLNAENADLRERLARLENIEKAMTPPEGGWVDIDIPEILPPERKIVATGVAHGKVIRQRVVEYIRDDETTDGEGGDAA